MRRSPRHFGSSFPPQRGEPQVALAGPRNLSKCCRFQQHCPDSKIPLHGPISRMRSPLAFARFLLHLSASLMTKLTDSVLDLHAKRVTPQSRFNCTWTDSYFPHLDSLKTVFLPRFTKLKPFRHIRLASMLFKIDQITRSSHRKV